MPLNHFFYNQKKFWKQKGKKVRGKGRKGREIWKKQRKGRVREIGAVRADQVSPRDAERV